MIKAKILAMCFCPALAAPPAILAVSPPARHAVAHVLHHAANRLEHRAAPVANAPQLALLPCTPSLVASDGALPIVGSTGLGGIGGADLASLGILPASNGSGQTAFGGGSGYGGSSGFGGGGGMTASPADASHGASIARGETLPASGTGPTSAQAPVVPVSFSASSPPPVFGSGSSASTAPEPAAWMLMITGFGMIGAVVRMKRPAEGGRLTFPRTA